jgi:hypothetical protein
MRTYIVIPLVITALIAFLYFSDQYEQKTRRSEIRVYSCEEATSIPFLNKTTIPKPNNELVIYKKNLDTLPENIFKDFPCIESIF